MPITDPVPKSNKMVLKKPSISLFDDHVLEYTYRLFDYRTKVRLGQQNASTPPTQPIRTEISCSRNHPLRKSVGHPIQIRSLVGVSLPEILVMVNALPVNPLRVRLLQSLAGFLGREVAPQKDKKLTICIQWQLSYLEDIYVNKIKKTTSSSKVQPYFCKTLFAISSDHVSIFMSYVSYEQEPWIRQDTITSVTREGIDDTELQQLWGSLIYDALNVKLIERCEKMVIVNPTTSLEKLFRVAPIAAPEKQTIDSSEKGPEKRKQPAQEE